MRWRLADLLSRQHLLALATHGDGGPWACTLAFAFDERFDIVFLSRRDTRHVQEIRDDPRVAAAIHAPGRDRDPSKSRGAQLAGTAAILSGADAREALEVYTDRFKEARGQVTVERLRARKACAVRISPDRIWYRDHEALGGRVEVPLGRGQR